MWGRRFDPSFEKGPPSDLGAPNMFVDQRVLVCGDVIRIHP